MRKPVLGLLPLILLAACAPTASQGDRQSPAKYAVGFIVNQGDDWVMKVGNPENPVMNRPLKTGKSTDFGYGSYFFVTDLLQEERGPMVDFFAYDKLKYEASALTAGRAIYASPKLSNIQACVIRNPKPITIGQSYQGIYVESSESNGIFDGLAIRYWLEYGDPGQALPCTLTKVG